MPFSPDTKEFIYKYVNLQPQNLELINFKQLLITLNHSFRNFRINSCKIYGGYQQKVESAALFFFVTRVKS